MTRSCGAIMASLGLWLCTPAAAQDQGGVITAITVQGSQRIEPDTVRSYVGLAIGDRYTPEALDAAFKRLFATGLFADVTIRSLAGRIEITVVENPIINRIVFEGNKAIKNDDLNEEVRLQPRQVYTRAKVRADVQRIIELYRRKGRFAASVEPKIIQLEQNRVDLVFEIAEGQKSRVRQINFIGNRDFSDSDLRGEIATRESRWWRLFTSNDTFDPDRMAFDREKLRQFYLQQGYADFRVISAVAELTRDRKDFYITFTLEEGEIYDFGEINVESQIRDLKPELLKHLLLTRSGKRYNAKLIEDSVEALTNFAGLGGYAFVDIRPRVRRDRENRKMNITFQVLEAPRVYVERINIYGNVRTLDNVVRREFRLAEGDAFNTVKLERSKQRIQSLGFFQEEMEIERIQGSTPDKIILEVNVEERATGELSLGAGFSSLENFLFDFSIRERNLLGRGQELRLGATISSRRKQVDIGFTEPYF
ncbi:MAG: outer membrane protein assembly factor BamA, partial [Alphaproteobacteria bacterium]